MIIILKYKNLFKLIPEAYNNRYINSFRAKLLDKLNFLPS